jgi:hypothetical protein
MCRPDAWVELNLCAAVRDCGQGNNRVAMDRASAECTQGAMRNLVANLGG